MTTVVSSPVQKEGSSGAVVGVFAILVLALLFIYFGIPALRSMGTPQVNVPAPVINMPDKVDVNVQQQP